MLPVLRLNRELDTCHMSLPIPGAWAVSSAKRDKVHSIFVGDRGTSIKKVMGALDVFFGSLKTSALSCST